MFAKMLDGAAWRPRSSRLGMLQTSGLPPWDSIPPEPQFTRFRAVPGGGPGTGLVSRHARTADHVRQGAAGGDADAESGAAYGTRSSERMNSCGGNRERDFDTPLGARPRWRAGPGLATYLGTVRIGIDRGVRRPNRYRVWIHEGPEATAPVAAGSTVR